MKPQALASGFEAAFRANGNYDISVEASAQLDVHGLVQWVRSIDPECENRLPHNKIQVSTVGAIRAVGADVVLTEPPEGHHSVRFQVQPTDDDLTALMAAFEQPQENPVARPKHT